MATKYLDEKEFKALMNDMVTAMFESNDKGETTVEPLAACLRVAYAVRELADEKLSDRERVGCLHLLHSMLDDLNAQGN